MRSTWPTGLLTGALALLFVAEKLAAGSGLQDWLRAAAAGLLLATLAARAIRWRQAEGAERRAEGWLLAAASGVVFAVLLWWLSTDQGLDALGLQGEGRERLDVILSVGWLVVLLCSGGALLAMEAAYRRMPVAEAVELRRVARAASSGVSLALSVVFLGSVGYVAHVENVKKDLTYFKTTEPSEGTLKLVRGLGEPVRAVLFYPRVNEVLEELKPYFDRLAAESDQFTVEVRDHALAPELARRHRITGNGVVAFVKGEGARAQVEKLDIGEKLEWARRKLRTLDGRVQKALSRLVRIRRLVYLTAGHREHTAGGAEGDGPGDRTRDLMDAFARSNIETRPLGMAQGLGSDVPEDAPMVMVVGPREPFLPEEARALVRYLKRGGRLVVMVDPDVEHGLQPLFSFAGLKLRQGVVASERNFLRKSFTLADRANIVTNRYGAHPVVTTVSRHAGRVATVFVRGGALERLEKGAKKRTNIVFPVRTAPTGFWLERDGDYRKGPQEPSEGFDLVAAVTVTPEQGGEEGRLVVIADGDFVTDKVFRNPGNALVLADVVQWMLGEEQIVGEAVSEEDVRIQHSREEDQLWFWLTSVGVPLPLLGMAWRAARRRRRRRRETHREGGGDAVGGPPPGEGGDDEEGEKRAQADGAEAA